MNADFQAALNMYVADGWVITNMTDQQFVATKKGPYSTVGLVFGVLGLFFYLVPGLLILLLTAVARSNKSIVVTVEQAEAAALADEQVNRQAEASNLAYREMVANMTPRQKLWELHRAKLFLAALALFVLVVVIAGQLTTY